MIGADEEIGTGTEIGIEIDTGKEVESGIGIGIEMMIGGGGTMIEGQDPKRSGTEMSVGDMMYEMSEMSVTGIDGGTTGTTGIGTAMNQDEIDHLVQALL